MVCTGMYQVYTGKVTCKFDIEQLNGTLISLSCTTAYMSSTQSIITHSQKSQKSILRMFLVILVHTGMYLYVLGTYMYVPTA